MKKSLRSQIVGVSFSNPRRLAVFHDWPAADKRVTCEFAVQTDDSGRQRALRWTTGKPVSTHWYDRVKIVDGSDGRTYVICYSGDRVASEGRAVVYAGSLKPECVIIESGLRFHEVRELCHA